MHLQEVKAQRCHILPLPPAKGSLKIIILSTSGADAVTKGADADGGGANPAAEGGGPAAAAAFLSRHCECRQRHRGLTLTVAIVVTSHGCLMQLSVL